MVPAHWGQVACIFIEISRLVRAVYATRMKIILKNHINRGFWPPSEAEGLRRGIYIANYFCIFENPSTIGGWGGVPWHVGSPHTARRGSARACVRARNRCLSKNIKKYSKTAPPRSPNPGPPLRLGTNFLTRTAPTPVSIPQHHGSRT
jgi:hypothetical protein